MTTETNRLVAKSSQVLENLMQRRKSSIYLFASPLGEGGGGVTHSLLTVVAKPLTVHSLQDSAMTLFPNRNLSNIWTSVAFSHTLPKNILHGHIIARILCLSCFTVYAHHPSATKAIVFLLPSHVSDGFMPPPLISHISPNTAPRSPL